MRAAAGLRSVELAISAEHGELVTDLEFRRLSGPRMSLQVGRALHLRFGRDDGAGWLARDQAHVLLLSCDAARERQPGAQRFARGHRVGLDRQAVSDAHVPRCEARTAAGAGVVAQLPVVRIALSSGLSVNSTGGCAPRARLGAQAEQVRGGAREVAALAVDVHVLEQARRIPGVELRVAQVGDLRRARAPTRRRRSCGKSRRMRRMRSRSNAAATRASGARAGSRERGGDRGASASRKSPGVHDDPAIAAVRPQAESRRERTNKASKRRCTGAGVRGADRWENGIAGSRLLAVHVTIAALCSTRPGTVNNLFLQFDSR